MIPKIFKPEDFQINFSDKLWPSIHESMLLSNKSQSIFEAWIKNNSKVVYGKYDGPDYFVCSTVFDGTLNQDTHQALLINIEPIEQKECEHQSVIRDFGPKEINYKCESCNKYLKPKWEVIE
jgi:hypothetical protein